MQSPPYSESSSDEEEDNTKQKTTETPKIVDESDSSLSSSSEEEPTRSPSPVKDKKKRKKHKKKEPTIIKTFDSPTLDHTKEKVHHPQVKPIKKRKRTEKQLIPTSHPNVVVEMKKRTKGPKTQKVVVYQEDIPPPKYKIVTKTHKKGRPKTKSEVEVDEDTGINMSEDAIVIDRPSNKKEMSAKQLRRMELDAEFVKMEQIAGRKLRQTKSGKVDKRCLKERSPAQIAAARRLAEYNKELRKAKADEKNRQAVKDVITELAVTQEMKNSDQKSKAQDEVPKTATSYHEFSDLF